MSDIAIKVENLSKRYRIGLKEETKDTFVGAMGSILKSPFQNLKRINKLTSFNENKNESDDIIWALKDISFKVNHGEIYGVIGANGAGKSTLLKIIAQITHPTSGIVEFNGRVASLLEVGTGFHPELTGRENIYLNGTILGMTKIEINNKFDEIVHFSGVRKFIDTPVKRYSSGMRVRLAFSVAAHLDPEILLIDEVLSVGDANFKKKALRKMEGQTISEGRTVLFVSHDLEAVRRLCTSCILLANGHIVAQGTPNNVIDYYLNGDREINNSIWENHSPGSSLELARLNSASIKTSDGKINKRYDSQKTIVVELNFSIRKRLTCVLPAINLYDDKGNYIFCAIDTNDYWLTAKNAGTYIASAIIPENLLCEGVYDLSILLVTPTHGILSKKYFNEERILQFEVHDNRDGNSASGILVNSKWEKAIIKPKLKWDCKYIN